MNTCGKMKGWVQEGFNDGLVFNFVCFVFIEIHTTRKFITISTANWEIYIELQNSALEHMKAYLI